MAVRHLGELKKKKKSYRARAGVGIHESTYAVGVHFSQAPEAWTPANPREVAAGIPGAGRPPPTARGARARCPRARGPPKTPAGPEPQAPLPPGRAQPSSRLAGHPGVARGGKALPARPARPSPAPPARRERGSRPPPPPVSAAPGEGGPGRGLRQPGSRILGAAASHTCRRGPRAPSPAAAPRGRPAPRLRDGNRAAGAHRDALEDAPGRGCPHVFGVAVADNGGLLAAAIAHQVIHVALPTGHLRALRTAAGTARSSRRSGGGGGGRRRGEAGRGRGGGGSAQAPTAPLPGEPRREDARTAAREQRRARRPVPARAAGLPNRAGG